jgi:CDP-glycerol glycerophosphotransferase (TagB/SpsB family)
LIEKQENNFLRVIIAIFAFPLHLIGYLVPKNKNLWVFGAWLGEKYADNPKYLYEYVLDHTDDNAVWLTKNQNVYNELLANGRPVFYFYSAKGILCALRAKYVVFCVAYQDLSILCYLFSANAKVINLWHGTPLKRLTVERTQVQTIFRRILISIMGREADYVASTTPLVSKKLSKYFDIPSDHFLEYGYPRNDALFKKNKIPINLGTVIKDKRVILYMPTFREYEVEGSRIDLFSDYGFNGRNLDKILENNNALLLVKLHFRDAPLFDSVSSHVGDNIILLNDEQVKGDIYPLLSLTDILITDYSSVYFDFLLLNRPIVFSSFDIEHYEQSDRGFYFSYNDVTPGQKVDDWSGVEKSLEVILQNRIDESEHRQKVSERFNGANKVGSSKRIYDSLTKD